MRMRQISYKTHLSITGYVYSLPALLVIAVFVLFPFLLGLWQSFFSGFGRELHFVGIQNYIRIFTDARFWNSLKVTVIFSALSTALSGFLGFIAARWLTQRKIRMAKPFTSLLFLPYVVTPAIATLVWQYMFDRRYGILNAALNSVGLEGAAWLGSPSSALLSLILVHVWFTVGYNAVIFSSGLQAIPEDYYESADIDGADEARQTIHITLPLIIPTIVLVLVLSLMAGFVNSFVIAQIFTNGGPFRGTEVLMLFIYKTAFEAFDISQANALSLIMFTLLFSISYYLQRWQDKMYHGL